MTKRKIIYFLCYLAYSAIYIARVNLTMSAPSLLAAGALGTVEIGILGGAFSAVFALGRLLNGVLSDRVPPPFMIGGGLALCAAANIAFGFFPPFIGILLLWSANAYAQSMLWGSMLSLMSQFYDENTAKKRTAFLSTSVATGNIVGILFCTWLIGKFGVSFAFIVPGGITLALGLAFFAFAKDVPTLHTQNKRTSFFKLLCQKELRIINIPAFLHGILKENISLWMAVYIFHAYGIDLEGSAYYLLLIPAFGFVGRVMHQVFYRMFDENEHRVSLVAFAACAAVSLMLLAEPSPVYSVLCLTALYGAVSMINTSFLSVYPHRYKAQGNVASVSGIVDFVTYLGAAFGSMIYGALIKSFGYGTMFVSFAIFSLLGLIIISKFANIRGKVQ